MLGFLDVVVLGAYFAAILAVGLWFGRGEQNTFDYFLGGRRQHWLIVGLSLVATEVSALTFINVPADSFRGDWNYLQMYAGAFLGRMLIVYLLLPAFFGGAVTTVYEYLGQRYGPWTRTTASLMFVASRIIGSGIRLLAASMAIAVLFDWPLAWVVLGATAIATAYTTFGGIKAVIWTDALQALVFLGGAIAVVVFLFLSIPGSWTDNLAAAREAGKLHTFTWGFDLNNERVFWVLLISSTVQNCAALGVDQDLTQRMLTCPDLRRGQRSLLFNALIGLPVVCLFLLIGTLLSAYYGSGGEALSTSRAGHGGEWVFPYFIAESLPSGYGLKGLLVAGIFAAAMSSLDSALGALSSTVVTDLYRPLVVWRRGRSVASASREKSDGSKDLLIARLCTFFFGVLLAGVALAFAGYDDLLWEAFKWVGLIFGGLLGVFLLGVTTPMRGHDKANVGAMLSSVAILVALKLYQEHTQTLYLAWPWWVVVGTAWTYALASLFRTGVSRNGPGAARHRFGPGSPDDRTAGD